MRDGISQQLFLTVNAYGLLITVLLSALAAISRSRGERLIRTRVLRVLRRRGGAR